MVSNYLAECKKAGVDPIELTGPSDSKDVFQACREGDKLALAAADTMADYLGRALALIANVVDPEMFLIGGGASASAPPENSWCKEAKAAPQNMPWPFRLRRLGIGVLP